VPAFVSNRNARTINISFDTVPPIFKRANTIMTIISRFFMGHKGNIEAVYTTRKNLPESLMENMREIFRPAEEYLSTIPRLTSMEDQRKRDFLKTAELSGWFKDEELELIHQMTKVKA